MTGQVQPDERQRYWNSRRVFFVTPQVLMNDIKRGSCPANSIVCLVVDEAHRAQGAYAYCTVIQEIASVTRSFRVLGLSASPGSNTDSVQSVIHNLMISHLEVRTENDLDVRQYVHETSVETIVLPLSGQIIQVRNQFLGVLKIPIERLFALKVFYSTKLESISQFQLITAREKVRKNPPSHIELNQMPVLEGLFGIAIQLYSAWKNLNTHGLQSFQKSIQSTDQAAKTGGKMKKEFFSRTAEWKELLHLVDQLTDPTGYNHPKVAKLEELLLEHFNQNQDRDTRAMVFVQYRDSVNEIVSMLAQHSPLIIAMPFVGQAAGKGEGGTKGLSQKEQAEVIRKFREGGYNTLVATCIGEEGLDIGEVDLIVCFDAQASPTRMVQRMGRTGRKRDGRCVVLITEGPEESTYKNSKSKWKSVYKAINERADKFILYDHNPRMIPQGTK